MKLSTIIAIVAVAALAAVGVYYWRTREEEAGSTAPLRTQNADRARALLGTSGGRAALAGVGASYTGITLQPGATTFIGREAIEGGENGAA